MSRNLRAKSESNSSLREHCEAVASTAQSIATTPGADRLTTAVTDANITVDVLGQLAHIAGRLHDTGKAHPEWQNACGARICGDENPPTLPAHSARGAMYAGLLLEQRDISQIERLAVVLAILHHHTPLATRHMDLTETSARTMADELEPMVESLVDDGYQRVHPTPARCQEVQNAIEQARRQLSPGDDEYWLLGVLTLLVRNALVQADHAVSAGADTTKLTPSQLRPESISLFDSLRPFQQQIGATDVTELIGLAGCGEGKTHSALQWGQQRVKAGDADRLVIAMPTQVTTNNLLLSLTGGTQSNTDSAVTHVAPEATALYHSAAESFYMEDTVTERWDTSQVARTIRAGEWFQRPVTVTTVDHVLATLVNGYRYAGIARGNLLRGAVVFDELHAYDTYTVGHILGAIEHLSTLGVPWYVMTATLPPSIREHRVFSQASEETSAGRLRESHPPREPFQVTVRDYELGVEDITTEAGSADARRVMVVKNTVREAQTIARQLRKQGADVIYYSSEFPRADRDMKEAEIRQRFAPDVDATNRTYLVTTQICEISLDLSADLLLTDVAPIDAMLQRFGRVHREGVKTDAGACRAVTDECRACQQRPDDFTYRCIVYAPEASDIDYWYPYASTTDSSEWSLLERSADALRDGVDYQFTQSQEWVASAYEPMMREFDVETLRRAARTDWLYGPRRTVAPDADGDFEQLRLRSISAHRTSVFASEYQLANGEEWDVDEWWDTYHDCSASNSCGVYDEGGLNPCRAELHEFRQEYAIPIPAYWLTSGADPTVQTQRLSGKCGAIKGTRVASVVYSYNEGVRPR